MIKFIFKSYTHNLIVVYHNFEMNQTKKLFLDVRNSFLEFKRYRGKINIQRPQKLHFVRQIFENVSKPIIPKVRLPEVEKCSFLKFDKCAKPDNPFELILAKECANWITNSRMIIFIHVNPMYMCDLNPVKYELKRSKFSLKMYGKQIVNRAVENTPYEAISQLFCSHNYMIFSRRLNIEKALNILKKAPQLIVLAGVLEGRFVSKNELITYSKIKSLSAAQSELCHVLQSASLNLVNQLTQQPMSIVNSLDTFVKMKQDEIAGENKNNSETSE